MRRRVRPLRGAERFRPGNHACEGTRRAAPGAGDGRGGFRSAEGSPGGARGDRTSSAPSPTTSAMSSRGRRRCAPWLSASTRGRIRCRLAPRVIWDVAPPAPDYPGRHELLWQLVIETPAHRPRNLRPHDPRSLWRHDQVDDVIRLVEDLHVVVTARDAPARLTAARAVVNRNPWWVSPWFASPRVRCAIGRLMLVAAPEATAAGARRRSTSGRGPWTTYCRRPSWTRWRRRRTCTRSPPCEATGWDADTGRRTAHRGRGPRADTRIDEAKASELALLGLLLARAGRRSRGPRSPRGTARRP